MATATNVTREEGSAKPARTDARRDLIAITHSDNAMLVTISVVVLIIWLAGVVTANTLGGLIHLLLLVALIALFVEFLERHGPS